MSTALKDLRPAWDDCFPINDLFEMDLKFLKFSVLSMDLNPIGDERFLKRSLLILGDFL